MKKNSGFVLFETLITSTLVLGTLIFLYIQITSLKKSYKESFTYNTIPGIYNANVLANYLEKTGYSDIVEQLGDNHYIDITNCVLASPLCTEIVNKINAKTVLFTRSNITSLKEELQQTNLSKKFINYIKKLPDVKENANYRLLIEYNNKTYASVVVDDDLTLKTEYDIVNMLDNSSFENGINNWTLLNSVAQTNTTSETKKSGNYSLKLLTSGKEALYQTVSLKKNHTYYMSEYVYLQNKPDATLEDISQIDNTPNIGLIGIISNYTDNSYILLNELENKKWSKVDKIFTAESTISTKYYSIYTTSENNVYIDNVLLVDLTDHFGSGNEPNLEWCKKNIKYFDGTTKIYK